jgi:hypothetical protein
VPRPSDASWVRGDRVVAETAPPFPLTAAIDLAVIDAASRGGIEELRRAHVDGRSRCDASLIARCPTSTRPFRVSTVDGVRDGAVRGS